MTNAAMPWINDANRVWADAGGRPSVTIRRYNRGFVRWPFPWRSRQISFSVVTTPVAQSDAAFAVVVDGALAATVQPAGAFPNAGTLYPVRCYVNDLPIDAVNGSRVEVWETDGGREEPGLNNAADIPIHCGYVTGAWLPPGQRITRVTAQKCVIILGDSIPSSTNQVPAVWHGMVGQLRLIAGSQDPEVVIVSLDGGSFTQCGDGFTPAQQASLVQLAVAATGASEVWVYRQIGRNDWKYWFDPARANQTSAQVLAAINASNAALPAFYQKVVCVPITQLPPIQTDPYGIQPEALAAYQNAEATATGTNVVVIDGRTFGIDPAVDLYDGVHLLAAPLGLGVAKNLAGMRASVGLP